MPRHAYLVADALTARITELEIEQGRARGPWLDRVLDDLTATWTLLAALGRGSLLGFPLVQDFSNAADISNASRSESIPDGGAGSRLAVGAIAPGWTPRTSATRRYSSSPSQADPSSANSYSARSSLSMSTEAASASSRRVFPSATRRRRSSVPGFPVDTHH